MSDVDRLEASALPYWFDTGLRAADIVAIMSNRFS